MTTSLISSLSIACMAVSYGALSVPASLTTGVQTFDSTPVAADWSTLSITGAAGTLSTIVAVENAAQALTAAGINTPLGTQTANPSNGIAQRSSTSNFIYTAATGNNATALMATLQNDSGGTLNSITVAYDHTRIGGGAEESMGHRVFYSLSGLANSWTLIPALSGVGTSQSLSANFAITSSWSSLGKLYLLWVDDNGSGTDGPFTIDNFVVTAVSNPPPVIALTAPANGAFTSAPGDFSLTATATDNGAVTQVEFLRNSSVIHTDTSSPYSFVDSTLAAGSYSYTARATDNQGATGVSSAAVVSVFTDPSNTALQFDGVNDYVTMGVAPALNAGGPPSNGFTLECWFRKDGAGVTTSTGTGGITAIPLFSKGRSEGDGSTIDCNYFLGIDANGKLVADFESFASGLNHPVTANNAAVANNTWYHAAVTYDGNNTIWRVYLDGVQVGTATPSIANSLPRYDNIQHFGIGAALNSSGVSAGAFAGRIDEVRVWNYARSAAEIIGAKDTEVVAATGLIGRYGLNEGSGLTTANSPNAGVPAGTLTNGPLWVDGVTLTPNDTPLVNLTAPLAGTSFVAPAAVSLTADATDPDGSISKVEFYQGVSKLGEDTSAPYEFLWSLPNAAATYSLTAVATDNRGRTSTSTAASINVNASSNGPPAVTVSAPADNATGIGSTTNLTVNIADPEGDAQTVTFYGRKRAPLVPGPDFSLGTLPDTQFYSQNTGGTRAATFYQQTQWYADNRDTLNLAFVSHMGDMVQDNDSIDQQWVVASTAMSTVENQPATLRAYGIPWGGAPGNHDVAGGGATGDRVNAKWNQYFGNNRWAGKPYYKGSFSGISSGNNYQFFSASGLDFIIIHLEYMTSGNQAVLDWADALLKAHPHRRAIVTSHWILNSPPNTPVPAQSPFGGPGQAIYDNLKDNPNLFMTLCGHIHNEGRRADVYQGRTVYSLLQDYQDRANGGDGWLRYYVFSPATGTILAKTYSPKLGVYETNGDLTKDPRDTVNNEASEFTLAYDMQGSVSDWIPLGTVNLATNETTATLPWTGLEKSSAYEWYATANDGINAANSSVAKFATVTAAAPAVSITSPVNGQNVGLPAAVNIAATATDADGTIAKVAFFNGSTLLNEDTTAPYEYAWSAPSGNYTLTAIATDNEGNATLSNVVTFSVFNAANLLPTVALTSPADATSVEAGTISLTATATDTDGLITKVEFFNGAVKLGEDTTSPYTFDWSGVTVGTYSLTAKATDNDSGTATSAAITLTVTPAGAFVASYFQNFDGMGLSGTARRPAWTTWNGAAGTGNSTWSTSITSAGVAAMTENTGVLGVANPPAGNNNNGINAGLTATDTNRQFGSAPTTTAGAAHQLQLTNTSGSPISNLNIAYDIRRYNATSSENELPGYWLFYSLDGTTWTNVAALNPTSANVPNSAGLTSLSPTNFTLAGPWANNSVLRLRWVDDNGQPTSPDQMYGLDNVVIHTGVSAATALTATPVVNGDGIALAWTDNSNNETGFRIERKPAAAALWNLLTNTPADAVSHADATAGPGGSFDYRVTAFNAVVTGDSSNIANSAAYTALQDWKLATQGNPNAPNNSDNDGISDLFEFAF